MLKDIFLSLATRYTDVDSATTLWAEIETAYTHKKRYYHNLAHLQNMYSYLLECKAQAEDWDTMLFALFYHDIVYKATSKDNEEKSAAIAVKHLTAINYPEEKITKCHGLIMATKHHNTSADNDTALLTDADMAILGANWTAYETYYKAVRKEYAIYPDFLYNPGRAKVLQHFLGMESIFGTQFFKAKYEAAARENINRELYSIGAKPS